MKPMWLKLVRYVCEKIIKSYSRIIVTTTSHFMPCRTSHFTPCHAVIISLVIGIVWCCLVAAGLTYPMSARAKIVERMKSQRMKSEVLLKFQQNPMEHDPTLPIGSPSLTISMDMDEEILLKFQQNPMEHDPSQKMSICPAAVIDFDPPPSTSANTRLPASTNRRKLLSQSESRINLNQSLPKRDKPGELRLSDTRRFEQDKGIPAKIALDMEVEQAVKAPATNRPKLLTRSESRVNFDQSLLKRDKPGELRLSDTRRVEQNKGNPAKTLDMEFEQAVKAPATNRPKLLTRSESRMNFDQSLLKRDKPGELRLSDTKRVEQNKGISPKMLDMKSEQAVKALATNPRKLLARSESRMDFDQSLPKPDKASELRLSDTRRVEQNKENPANGPRKTLLDIEFEEAMKSLKIKSQDNELRNSNKSNTMRDSDTRKPGREKREGPTKTLLDMEFEQATQSLRNKKSKQQETNNLSSSIRSKKRNGLRHSDTKKAEQEEEGPTKTSLDVEFEQAVKSFQHEKSEQQETTNLSSSFGRRSKSALTQSMKSQEDNSNVGVKRGNWGTLKNSLTASQKEKKAEQEKKEGPTKTSLDMEFEQAVKSFKNEKSEQQATNNLSSSIRSKKRNGLRHSATKKAEQEKEGPTKTSLDVEFEKAVKSFKNKKTEQQETANLSSSFGRSSKSALTQSMTLQNGNNNLDANKVSGNPKKLSNSWTATKRGNGLRRSNTKKAEQEKEGPTKTLIDIEFEEAVKSLKNEKQEQQETNNKTSGNRGKKNRKPCELRLSDARKAEQNSLLDKEYEEAMKSFKNEKRQPLRRPKRENINAARHTLNRSDPGMSAKPLTEDDKSGRLRRSETRNAARQKTLIDIEFEEAMKSFKRKKSQQ